MESIICELERVRDGLIIIDGELDIMLDELERVRYELEIFGD